MDLGLTILTVGMITVFVVLGLVVVTGQLLIRVANYFYKEPKITFHHPATTINNPYDVEPQEIAVITAAVNVVTQGTGNIISIKKIVRAPKIK